MLLSNYAELRENTPGRQKKMKGETWMFGTTKVLYFNKLSTLVCKLKQNL